MKRLASFLIMLVLMLGCFAICSDTPADAAKKIWTTEYYTDNSGDATDEWYIVSKSPFSGTFNNASANNKKLKAEILVDEVGVYIKLFEDGKTPVKNASPLPEVYAVSLKTAEGQTLEFEGVMYGEDDRIHVLDAADLVTALCGGDEIKIYVEKYSESTTNYLFSVKGSNFAAQLDSIKEPYYKNALAIVQAGRYEAAIAAFTPLIGYKDSAEQIKLCETAILDAAYDEAEALLAEGKTAAAAIAFNRIGEHKDAQARSNELWKSARKAGLWETVSAGGYHSVGLKSDGTVVAVGDNGYGRCEVSGWTDIVAISAGIVHTVGLKADGTVVAVGSNKQCQCDVSDWTDIVAISAGGFHAVGLKADGTVVAVGENDHGQCNVGDWTDIVAISAGYYHTVGLKTDGTVVATEYTGDYNYGQCDVNDWTDIVAISAGIGHTVGLKADGTVVAVGWNEHGQCDVSGWTDIVAISAGGGHTVGLKADGTVVAVGWNGYSQCDVSGWTDIVAVSAGRCHTVGLKADGTVVAVGDNGDGECDVGDWTDIRVPGI